MTLKNARPRFAFETDNGLLYDYLLNKGHAPTGELKEDAGTWDLARVKELIEANLPIEAAFSPAEEKPTAAELRAKLAVAEKHEKDTAKAEQEAKDAVAKANADFNAAVPDATDQAAKATAAAEAAGK